MKKSLFSLLAIVLAVGTIFTVSADNRSMPADVQRLHDEIRAEFAPDKRVATFDVDYTFSDKSVMLRVQTTSVEAKNKLVVALRKMGYNSALCTRLFGRDGYSGPARYARKAA